MLADDSHEISSLIFFRKLEKMLQNLLSAAVVIGALKVKLEIIYIYRCMASFKFLFSEVQDIGNVRNSLL